MISVASGHDDMWMLLALISLMVLMTLLVVHLYFSSTESYKLGLAIPGPDPIPLLGNAHMAIGKTCYGE